MVDEGNGSRRVAIACQGGGSHTAFTAGALKRIPEKRELVPMFMTQIENRHNELAGNISLNHELSLINDYNNVLKVVKKYIPSESEFWRKYKPINVRKIELNEDGLLDGLTVGSKMNHNPQFIQDMMKYGWRTADKFLKELT